MKKQALHIVSASEGSIGEITKDLLPYFQDAFGVTIEGDDDPKDYKMLLCHFLNPNIVQDKAFNKFKKKILIQPIDGTSIKEDVIELMNKFDLIITPGEAGKRIMQEQGVTKPIKVIHNFYKDEVLIKPMNTIVKELPEGKIFFYHESTCHPRKGIEIMYEGFIRAFSDTEYADKVVLLVKGSGFNEGSFERVEDIKLDVISLQKQFKHPAQIIKISQNLKKETLKKIWNNIHLYVSFAKIEGFGIPLLRMALLNKPILTLDSSVSGYTDWLNKDNVYLIPTKLITATDEFMFLYKRDTKWSVPLNINDVVEGYRTSLKDYLENKSKIVNFKDIESMHIDVIAKKYITTVKTLF